MPGNKTLRNTLLAGLLLAAISALPVAAQPQSPFNANPAALREGTYMLDPAHGKITWSVMHLGLSRYQGQIAGVKGELRLDPKAPEQSTLLVTIPMDGGGTFDADLDAHLRSADFFDVAKYPTATFTATRIERVGERGARVTGDLTLRGITKPVTFEAVFNSAGIHPVTKRYTAGFDGTATIRRSEFGMTYLVPGVSDEVRLQLEGEFQLSE